jgi:phenylalanyl-tRNA synthetase beta chain
MPTIEISHRDLCRLVTKNIPVSELRESGILYAKGEIDDVNGDLLKIDIKDTNRPDLWSTEGIAREIRGRYVSGGLPEYKTRKSGISVHVGRRLKNIRPYTVCAVVKNLEIDDDVLSQMIQLQDKVSMTFGRNRKEIAIGAYDLSKIKPPIRFTTTRPDGIRFIPLDFEKKLTPREILEQHPKGKEFGHLLEGLSEYPIFIDSNGEVLSLPPVINSEYTGKVTKHTRDVFIECSGFDLKFLAPALNVVVTALSERGGSIETVEITYPDKKIVTPDLEPKRFEADLDYLNKISGLALSAEKACGLLMKSGYDAKPSGKRIRLLYPAYRQDIMHQRDVVEDLLISHGYNEVEPVLPGLATTGRPSQTEVFSGKIADIMTGLGLQETVSYILTNKKNLFENMNLKEDRTVEIENATSANWCIFRTWLVPGLMDILSNNRHVDYPQRIFETGDVVVLDSTRETRTRNARKTAVAITDNVVGYEDISSMLDAVLSSLGIKYRLVRSDHRSFIKGRAADVLVSGKRAGIVGEINPVVLEKWNLDRPVACFELDLDALRNAVERK